MRPLLPFLCVLSLSGCLSLSPEEEAEAALGDADHCVFDPGEDERECGSPLHRPGQPCLVCHSSEHNPGEEIFTVAGTVYRFADDAEGLPGARVSIIDAEGNAVTVPTNAAGTFYVKDNRSELAIDARDGEAKVPFEIVFPLEVEISHEGISQTMRSLIWREGSCAACHQAEAGPASAGKIYLEER